MMLIYLKNVLSNLTEQDKSHILLMSLNSSLVLVHNITIPTNTSKLLNITETGENMCNFTAVNVSRMIISIQYLSINTL